MRPLPDALTSAEDRAITNAIRAERAAKLARQARRYLDTHCRVDGTRSRWCLTEREYAAECGVCRQVMFNAINNERRARGLDVREQTPYADEEDRDRRRRAAKGLGMRWRQIVRRVGANKMEAGDGKRV
jgi:hypothetical protein